MKNIKNLFCIILSIFVFTPIANAANVWNNNLRSTFLSNKAIMYAINIRTFNAQDTNKNGIIEFNQGEERGSFSNAIDRLDELQSYGINTIVLMPVTPVGKIKALGTAGSLYAASDFSSINPQLKSQDSNTSAENEMRLFIEECHRRNIRVMVDLPCCGAYDLYLKNPALFKKDKNDMPIIPSDWTDVRLLDAGTNEQINSDVFNLYKDFTDLMLDLNVDGIRANVASIKPYSFWKKLIDYTRNRNPQFLFLAESSPLDSNVCESAEFTPYNKLLEAGFDGYYGKYSELKNWTSAKDLISNVEADMAINKKHEGKKSVLANFVTHDQISPMLIYGPQYSKMIIWLNATLPVNSYFIDGFATGDNYMYLWGNKKAPETYTDDDYYFVHRGQMDIFNFSRKPQGKRTDILEDFIIANRLKILARNILENGSFVPLKTSNPKVFAYARSYKGETILVFGNINFKQEQENVIIKVPKINGDLMSTPIKIQNIPVIGKGEVKTTLYPGEIQVLLFNALELK